MKHELTALQYMQIMQRLPNPYLWYKEKFGNDREFTPATMKIAYLEDDNIQFEVYLASESQPMARYAKTNEMTFELVTTHSTLFWQPLDEVVIKRVKPRLF